MRDRVLLAVVALAVSAVCVNYIAARIPGTEHANVQFGTAAVSPKGLPRFLSGMKPRSRLTKLLSGVPQAQAQTFLRGRLAFYDQMMVGYSSVATGLNRLFYETMLPQQALIPVGIDRGEAFLLSHERALVHVTLSNTSLLEMARVNASDASRLAGAHPDVNFAYYGVSSWTMTPAAMSAGYADPLAPAWESFAGTVRPATAGSLVVRDWSELFFRTDHHWSPPGAYEGYLEIMDLLAASNPRVGADRLPFSEKTIPGADFRGASARRSAYVGISEPFRVLTTRDPAVHAFLRGRPADHLIAPDHYSEGLDNSLFFNHYAAYNGQDYPIIEYRTGRIGAGNLLILADSFSNSVEDLVASHFGTTYSVDLRHYQPEMGVAFDIDAFIAEHHISDVLIMGRPARVMSTPTALRMGRPVQ